MVPYYAAVTREVRSMWGLRDEGAGPAPEPGRDVERGMAEFLLGTLSASVLLPFVQAMVGRAGEEVYDKIRGLLSREERARAEAEIAESGTVTLVDPERLIVLRVPARMTPEQALTISGVVVAAERGWTLVEWDGDAGGWAVTPIAGPPVAGGDGAG
ncbi:hypothetical protein ACQEU3_01240 [Spirillospora sp. CA-253888]